MKYAVLKLWLLITFTFCSATVWSQVKKVSGKITDEETKPIIGVSVVIKGKNIGTQTSSTGDYTIDASQGDVLVFSHTSFTSQEVTVGLSETINVSMKAESTGLGEVVVVGYGTQRRKETTGSIASIKAAELTQTPIANVAQGIQSRVPGVQINQNSGAPGGNISVRIRGTNSITGTSEPLYIVDGIQISNGGGITDVSPLSTINPNDIESVEVLKDASASAIYGARAANGVVLITTKRGKLIFKPDCDPGIRGWTFIDRFF